MLNIFCRLFARIPLRVMLGTEWPILGMLQSAPFAQRFEDDPDLHCENAPPIIDFAAMIDALNQQDWYALTSFQKTIRLRR